MGTERTLAIFGITGKTGRALATAADTRGWHIRGLVRPGSQAPTGLRHAQLVEGTFADLERVAETIDGAQDVCSVIGPRPPYTDIFCAAATKAMVDAMRQTTCRRLVCQTGAMIGEASNRSWFFDRMARSFARRQPESARDRAEQERLVQASNLEWTIVKPPRLTDGPAAGSVRAGTALRVGLLSKISRTDLAEFILNEIDNPRFLRARVFVKG